MMRNATFLRYALVGIFNTVIYGALVWLFLRWTFFARYIAIAIAFSIAMLFQYSANRIFTFNSRQRRSAEVPKYLMAAALNYALTVFVIWLAVDVLSIPKGWAAMLAAGIVAGFGYVLALFWVYR
jgi:putative flippase GtrA